MGVLEVLVSFLIIFWNYESRENTLIQQLNIALFGI